MTNERIAYIDKLTRTPDAYGFRTECIELVAEVKKLRDANDMMRSLRVQGDYGPRLVAETLGRVASACDSSLHEVASCMMFRLMNEVACRSDDMADYRQLVELLRRLVANQDTKCRIDHHGYCQEHNFADPCPVPDAQRLTGSGTEYVSTKGTRF